MKKNYIKLDKFKEKHFFEIINLFIKHYSKVSEIKTFLDIKN